MGKRTQETKQDRKTITQNKQVMKKNKHGGARPGAGRKKLEEPRMAICFRVPENKAERLKRLIKNFLKRHV